MKHYLFLLFIVALFIFAARFIHKSPQPQAHPVVVAHGTPDWGSYYDDYGYDDYEASYFINRPAPKPPLDRMTMELIFPGYGWIE